MVEIGFGNKLIRKIELAISKEAFYLMLILLLAFSLRIWGISELPLFPDEGFHGNIIVQMINSEQIDYTAGVPWQGPMVTYVLTPSVYLFGSNLFYFRLPIVLFSTATIFLLYLFTTEYYNNRVALIAAFILAITPADIFLGKIAWEFSILSFFCIFSLWLFQRFSMTRKILYLYLFAFVSGLGIITRLSFLFFLGSFILTLKFNPFISIKNIISNLNIKKILILTLFFLIGIYPMLYYNLTENFPTLRYIFEVLPITKHGENLLDIKENTLNGIDKFGKFLDKGNVGSYFSFKLTFNLRIQVVLFLSMIFFIYFPNNNLVKRRDLRKNLYLLINFILIFVFISTITITNFKVADYIMLLSFSFIIIGWSVNSFLYLIKKQIFSFSILLILLIIYLSFILYNIFAYFDSYLEDKKEDPCNKFLNETIYYLTNISHSEIWADSSWHAEIFKFYIPKDEIHPIWDKFDSIDDVKKRLDMFIHDKNVIYVFASDECQSPIENIKLNTFNGFLNLVDEKKTLILEKSINEGTYTIYRII